MISQFTTDQILVILDKIRRDLFPGDFWSAGQFAAEQVANEQCIRFLHELAAYYEYVIEVRRQQYTAGPSQQPPFPNSGQTRRIQTSTAHPPLVGGTGAPLDAPRRRVLTPRLSRPPRPPRSLRPLTSSRYRRLAPAPAINTVPPTSNMVAGPAGNTPPTPANNTAPAPASSTVPAAASNTVSSTAATQTPERPSQGSITPHGSNSDGQSIRVLSSAPDSMDLELSARSLNRIINFARIDEGINRISALLSNLSANDFTKIAPDVTLVATETSGIGPLSEALSEISDEDWWTNLMRFYQTVVIQTDNSRDLLKLKNTIWRLNYIELYEFWERYSFFLPLH